MEGEGEESTPGREKGRPYTAWLGRGNLGAWFIKYWGGGRVRLFGSWGYRECGHGV